MPKLRNDEEMARDRFDQFVRITLGSNNIQWEESKHDPPDVWLKLNNQRYAVEITTTMDSYATLKGDIPSRGIDDAALKLVKEIEDEANVQRVLTGTYHLRLQEAGFFDFREKVKSELLNFICQTQSSSDGRKQIIIDRQLRSTIEKKSSDGQIIRYMRSGSKWGGDAHADMCRQLSDAISVKTGKMRHIAEPKILILISDSPFITLENYRQCIATMSEPLIFHAIFVTFRWRDEAIKDDVIYVVSELLS